MTEKKDAYVEGTQARTEDLEKRSTPTPCKLLVKRLMEEMGKIEFFQKTFGPMREWDRADQRWACYERGDWSMRQMPAIMVFDYGGESQTSLNGWLTGTIRIVALWPAQLRRHDWAEVPKIFKGMVQHFFHSKYCGALLDRIPGENLETKVGGLNELGKEISWIPNMAGMVAEERVPATILDIKYRIDLRRFYDYLEDLGYSQEEPFKQTVFPLEYVGATLQGTAGGVAEDSAKVTDGIKIQ